MAKFIFVTGGVVSGLGKGIAAASLGRLLKQRGLKVKVQKLDPYLNVDPGTMNPYQHGEVFVTDDGAETDLDLGHYERFIDENLTVHSSVSSGRVCHVRPRVPHRSHPRLRGAEEQAHPALGQGAFEPGHPARRDPLPLRRPGARRDPGQDFPVLQHPPGVRHSQSHRLHPLRGAPSAGEGGPGRRGGAAAGADLPRPRPDGVGHHGPPTRRGGWRSPWWASTWGSTTPTCRWWRP